MPVTITGLDILAAQVGPFQNNVEVAQHNSTPWTTTFDNFGATTGPQAVGVTFTTVSTNPITDVTLWVESSDLPTDSIVCNIYATSGGFPTGGSLGASALVAGNLSTMTTSNADGFPHKFAFATAVSVSNGVTYAAVLTRTGAQNDTVNYNLCSVTAPTGTTQQIVFQVGAWGVRAGNYPNFYIGTTNIEYFLIGRDGTVSTSVRAVKATNPTVSWSASTIQATIAVASPASFTAQQVGNIIHMAVGIISGANTIYEYYQFDMISETFTVVETAWSPGVTTGGSGSVLTGVSLGVRSTGEIVICGNATQVLSGTQRSRISYVRRTAAATWTAAVAVDGGGAVEYLIPEVTIGPMNDRVHFGFWSGTTTYNLRTLDDTNTLGTNRTSAFTATAGQPTQSVWFRRTSSVVACAVTVNGGTSTAVDSAIRFDSADSATIGGTSQIVTVGGSTPLAMFAEQDLTLGVSVTTTNVYALLRKSTDSDFYVYASADSGATWGAGTLVATGTYGSAGSALSRDMRIYQRGTNVVIPWASTDGTNLVYNEYVIRVVSLVTVVLYNLMNVG